MDRGLLYLIVLLVTVIGVITLYNVNSVSHTILRHPIQQQHQMVPDRFPAAMDPAPSGLALAQTSRDVAADIAPGAQSSMPDVLPDPTAPSLPSHHPYLITLKYEEQLASATRNVFQLVNLTVHWNRRAVEPFISGSTYSAVPSSPSLSGLFRFSEFYNASSVAAQMGDCFSKDLFLYSFEDFLVNATRNFLLLKFKMSGDKSGRVADCTSSQGEEFKKAENRLNAHVERVKSQAIAVHGQYYKFKGVRAICAEAYKLSVHNVAKEVLSESNKQLSIVVPNWRCIWDASAGGFFYYNPGYSWAFINKCHLFSFTRTQRIIDAANEFRNSLNIPETLIGVHMRIEKLAVDDRKQRGHLNGCLDKLHAVAQALLKKFNLTLNNIVVINDFSKYGSNSCTIGPRSKCNQLRDTVIKTLKSWGIQTVSYDPDSFKKPQHSGFVSLVEKEFLSGTNHLIVIGGGGYQSSVASLFSTKHQGVEPVYYTCQHFNPDSLNGLTI